MVRADGLTISELRNVGRDYTVEDTARFYYQFKFSELESDPDFQDYGKRRAEALKYATGQIREEYAQLPNVKQSGFTLEDLERMSSEIEERYKKPDDTDDIDEGTTNLYYTDQRVKDLLTGSSQTNISITEYDGQLIIEAENGVDDATTDDLDEGTTNLYYTDARVDTEFDTRLALKTTDNLTEGTTNLYFSGKRY
jgi:hypothetical protein